MRLANKAAVITGASRGIGRAIAMLFGREGCSVVINYKSNYEGARETAAAIEAEGGTALLFRADVCSRKEVDAMFDYCVRNFGKVDIAVNNAGVSSITPFTEISEEEWDRVVSCNLKGVFLCCQAALKLMIPRRVGKIINVASVWGLVGASCEAHYSAAKGGVIALTKALAKEVGPSGINVNAIAPGVIETDMLAGLSDEELTVLCSQTPLGRLGRPEDVARCALFLASEDSDFVTGAVICASGGFVIV